MDIIDNGQGIPLVATPSKAMIDGKPAYHHLDEAAYQRGQTPHVVHVDESPYQLRSDLEDHLKTFPESKQYAPPASTRRNIKRLQRMRAIKQATRMLEAEVEGNYAPTKLALFVSEQVWALSTPKAVKKKPTATELGGAEKFMAEAIMRSPLIWDVLNKQYADGLERIASTRDVVMPIYDLEATLQERLLDAGSFFRSFGGLTRDIASWSERLNDAYTSHAGRSGEVSAEDVALVTPLSQLYHEMNYEFDVVIKGGLSALVTILKEQTPDLVEA